MPALTNSIQEAVTKAEDSCTIKMRRVFTNISNSLVVGANIESMITAHDKESEIKASDVDKVINSTRRTHIPFKKMNIYLAPQSFMLDNQGEIRNPLGLYGSKLSLKAHLVSVPLNAAHNIINSINHAGLEIKDMIPSGVASSLAVLTEEEKKKGVLLIDLGAGTTDIALFHDGALMHTEVLPGGGNSITQSMATEFRIPFEYAERLKRSLDLTSSSKRGVSEQILISNRDASLRKVEQKELSQFIKSKVKELLSSLKKNLIDQGYIDKLGSGLVITGGGSLAGGLIEMAESLFQLPVKLGTPLMGEGGRSNLFKDNISLGWNSPLYATSMGLLLYGIKHYKKPKPWESKLEPNVLSKIKHVFSDYF